MFIQSRDDSRAFFLNTWHKMSAPERLTPLEALVAGVIAEHPDYHAVLSDVAATRNSDVLPADCTGNPFLHMGLHVALAEQLQADRPPGIRAIFATLNSAWAEDRHALEHRMVDCLGETLFTAQREGRMPDENVYLECLKWLR
jgi:hypothetical protein